MAPFQYGEFPENVSLALDVCQAVGIERGQALQGMWRVTPDVGAMTRWAFTEERNGRPHHLEFINGFAANDPESYIRVWKRLDLGSRPEAVIVLMNIRGDRQRRSKDLAPLLGRELKAASYVLIGEETALFADMLKRQGLARSAIVEASRLDAEALWERLIGLCPDGGCVVGIGNIAGIGNRLLAYLKHRGGVS
jgi:poly-gamma-glutamate synthase PgsB/CapB